jgi:hypothetical protein
MIVVLSIVRERHGDGTGPPDVTSGINEGLDE